MGAYFYLGCEKCKERVDASSKSGDLDIGAATLLGDSSELLPTFIIKHRNCGSLIVLSEPDIDDRTDLYSEFELRRG